MVLPSCPSCGIESLHHTYYYLMANQQYEAQGQAYASQDQFPIPKCKECMLKFKQSPKDENEKEILTSIKVTKNVINDAVK